MLYIAAASTTVLQHHVSDSVLSQPTTTGYAADFNFGMRYLVADCGGGTVDLTVHELEGKGRLKELYKATGGAWGSMGIDCQFEMLLVDIFGEEFLVKFVETKPIGWLELVSTFEAKKRAFSPDKHISVNISLPFAFIESYREYSGRTVQDAITHYSVDGIMWSTQGMLKLQPAVMMSLFEPVVSCIIHHIQELLQIPELSRIKYLFLVGGFSESPVLQEAIRNAFRSGLRVVIPQDVSLSIVKGAVMFGQDPTLVHVRRSTLTYGVGCLNRFIPGKHPPDKRVVKGGVEWCTGVFDTFVYADQPVGLGDAVMRSYTPAKTDQLSTVITVFASEKEFVHFVTDPGVSKVGEVRLEMPDTSGGKRRELQMSMIFGDTEISVEAVDCTSGQTATASLDFLNK